MIPLSQMGTFWKNGLINTQCILLLACTAAGLLREIAPAPRALAAQRPSVFPPSRPHRGQGPGDDYLIIIYTRTTINYYVSPSITI